MKCLLTMAMLAAALFVSGGVVVAEEPEGAENRADGSKQVCKRVRSTGSRIRQKVCHTERRWQQIREESRETLDKNRESRNVNRSGGDA